jgi:septum formation protein
MAEWRRRPDPVTRLILASASPRRADLLRAAGLPFAVHPAHVDETVLPGELPDAYVLRVAAEKARAIHRQHQDDLVLAADTTVIVDGHLLGKPADAAEAGRMLEMLAGRWHEVTTAVALAGPGAGRLDTRAVTTRVEFRALDRDEIEWYARSGEPMDKAGAYAIQGLASRFVTRIEGSYSNVVGLPVATVYDMLRPFLRASPPASP